MTALYVASRQAAKEGVTILADGGITKSGDMVKALTLADGLICGGLLAGCDEAPGRIMEINGKLYKQYRGMGSREAMKDGSAARYGHDKKDAVAKAAPEGIEALKEAAGPLDFVLRELIRRHPVRHGLPRRRRPQDPQGQRPVHPCQPRRPEGSRPHDVITVKTTPNNSAE